MRLLLASAIMAASAAATFTVVTAPASAETRTYAFSGFTKIEAKAGFRIEFTQSPTWSVTVDSKYDNLDKIIVLSFPTFVNPELLNKMPILLFFL